MYIKTKTIQNVYGDFTHNKFGLFLRRRGDYNLNLQILSDDFNEKHIFLEEETLGFFIKEDILIYNSSKEKQTYGVDLKTFKNLYSIDEILYDLHIKTRNIKGDYYYNLSEIDNKYIYNLLDGKENKIFENKTIEGFICAINNNFIINKKENNSLLCYSINELNINWQLNINTLFNTENESEIKQIKIYKDALIVASNNGISSIEIKTGKVNWATKTYALTIEIVENIGYACSSLSLFKINLDDGIMSDFGRENARLPDIQYNGKSYSAGGYEVIYDDELLWYAVYSQGASFIIAINPHDGYYEWVHYVEGSDKIDSVKFYQNRMYVLDTSGVLHVYEKDIE